MGSKFRSLLPANSDPG
uniref:Uncharacterized protein n=1 Tax=Arundo donax TaxID=35708 RepID=A0A0A8ZTK7_ARUDO